MPVIYTAWCHRPDGSDLGRMAEYWAGLAPVPFESHLAQIYPGMDYEPSDILIQKPKYNAFWATNLEAILNTLGIESLIFTGIATDVCVGQTLVDAFHRDYNCIIVQDGTATTTPHQEVSLWHHEKYWARVLTIDEVIDELRALTPVKAS